MKTNIFFCLLVLFLSGCSSINKILVIDDSFKEERSIKLLQCLEGFSDERETFFNDRDYYFPIKTVYTKAKNGESNVFLELKLTTIARPEELDSVVYLLVDNEKFKLISNNYAMRNYVNSSTSTSTETSTSVEKKKDSDSTQDEPKEKVTTSSSTTSTTTDQTLQAMKHTFEISPLLWSKLMQCETIMLRTYINNEGVDVLFKRKDVRKLNAFYFEVLREENSI